MTTTVKERPILFSAPMVRAILDGRKTQTRRVLRGQALEWMQTAGFTREFMASPENCSICPFGKAGDRLWVREKFARYDRIHYAATEDRPVYNGVEMAWCPSIHMPRNASRITLEVTGVRVERVQDISEADAVAEGFSISDCPGSEYQGAVPARENFQLLWEQLNGPRGFGWDANPWVWVVEFKEVKP